MGVPEEDEPLGKVLEGALSVLLAVDVGKSGLVPAGLVVAVNGQPVFNWEFEGEGTQPLLAAFRKRFQFELPKIVVAFDRLDASRAQQFDAAVHLAPTCGIA